jgi:hypothetical protein
MTVRNGPRRLKRIKALHWQTPVRDSFDPQRFSRALATHHHIERKDKPAGPRKCRSLAKTRPDQIHLASENQAKTMDEPEHNTAPKVINGRINGRFAKGFSGNPGGSPEATRRLVNKAFLEALAEDFRQGGAQAIAKVRKHQPAAYMKICALLVPREMKVEHSGGVKAMTDEELEQAIALIKAMIAAREAKTIEGTAETVALPAPDVAPDDKPKRQNKVMDAADTAVGARERKPRKRVPSPTGA